MISRRTFLKFLSAVPAAQFFMFKSTTAPEEVMIREEAARFVRNTLTITRDPIEITTFSDSYRKFLPGLSDLTLNVQWSDDGVNWYDAPEEEQIRDEVQVRKYLRSLRWQDQCRRGNKLEPGKRRDSSRL